MQLALLNVIQIHRRFLAHFGPFLLFFWLVFLSKVLFSPWRTENEKEMEFFEALRGKKECFEAKTEENQKKKKDPKSKKNEYFLVD